MPAAEVQPPPASRFPDGPAASPGFLLWHLTLAWQRAVARRLTYLQKAGVELNGASTAV